VKDFCGLARWSGAEVGQEVPIVDFPKSGASKNGNAGYVVLHPGAAFGSAKRWLPERFVELMKRFPNFHWRLVGNNEERERNAKMAGEIGSSLEDWTGRLSLPQLAEMMADARAVVCNDSGPMHLAAAVGSRVIAIFGSTEPMHTGPLGPGHRVVQKLVECSPCYLRECPIDLRCMKGVTVDDVEKILKEVLGS
jgi:heptosyltransferase-2